MRFSREEYWSGFPYPLSGNLPDPGIEPTSLVSVALASRFFLSLGTPGTSCKLIAESPKKVFGIAPLWSYFFFINQLCCYCSVAQTCPTLRDPVNRTRQASLFITNTRNSPKLMSIESVKPSSHLILCCPFFLLPPSLPASESFPVS